MQCYDLCSINIGEIGWSYPEAKSTYCWPLQIQLMSDGERWVKRRSVLKGSAAAGLGSLAGCSALPSLDGRNKSTNPTQTTAQKDAPDPTKDPPRWSGPRESRPKRGNEAGHEYFVDRGPEQGALYVWSGDKWTLMNAYADTGSFGTINGVRTASEHANGGSGTKDDRWKVDNSVMPNNGGAVFFEPGQFTTSGLTTPKKTNYEQTTVYFSGAGIRTTALHGDGSDGSVITFDAEKKGNFGGISDMGIFGKYPDGKRSKGDLIHGTGQIIDTIYENLIVRYGWGNGMYLNGSSSGTRIRNCWVENNAGWNIYLGGGTRTKLSNLHIISGKSGGIHLSPSDSQVNGVSMLNCAPGLEVTGQHNQISNCYFEESTGGTALVELDDRENAFSNITAAGAVVGVKAGGTRSTYSNVSVYQTEQQAFRALGNELTVTDLSISDFGKSDTPAIELSGSDCRFSGIRVSQPGTDYSSTELASITGKRNLISDVNCSGSGEWTVTVGKNAVETVLDNVRGVTLGSLNDNGARTLLNRQGTNAGDPSSGGEWSGHAAYAAGMGATVWNTKTSPWTPYRTAGGTWIKT